MTKTTKSVHRDENPVAELVRSLVDQICSVSWQVFSTIQHEVTRLIESLGKEVANTEALNKEPAVSKTEPIKIKSADDLAELEKIFEKRVSQALQRLQIPTRADLDNLNKRLDNLNKDIERLNKRK
jgi:poly(hydroxyalkanoate) granule-associated protein